MLELVVGIGLIAGVITAMVITTTYSLRNTQFSKNQSLATKLAQENLEKVRTIKIANYGVCLSTEDPLVDCSTWEEIWSTSFGSYGTCTTPPGCTFKFSNNCITSGASGNVTNVTNPICLVFASSAVPFGAADSVFTGYVILEDEAGAVTTQKRVTSKVFWNDSTGQHSSDLVTVFSKL